LDAYSSIAAVDEHDEYAAAGDVYDAELDSTNQI
jgi:hypothetical protein